MMMAMLLPPLRRDARLAGRCDGYRGGADTELRVTFVYMEKQDGRLSAGSRPPTCRRRSSAPRCIRPHAMATKLDRATRP
jgi:hypothetical protein